MWVHTIYGETVLETDLERALVDTANYVRDHAGDNPRFSIGKVKAIFRNALMRDPPSERHGDINVGDVHPPHEPMHCDGPQEVKLSIPAVDVQSMVDYLETHIAGEVIRDE